MKFIKNKLRSFIRKIIVEYLTDDIKNELFKEAYNKAFDNLAINYEFDFKNIQMPYIIKHYEISKLRFNISFQGNMLGNYWEFESVSDFIEFVNTFQPEKPFFNGCQFTVCYNHPRYGEMNQCEVFVNSMDNKVYNSSELNKIFDAIKGLFKDHPELMI